MSFSVAEHFAKIHGGFDSLIKLTDLINAGHDLNYIARQFKLSAAQICRLRNSLFQQIWTPKRGTLEYIEFQKHYFENEAVKRGNFIKEQSKLKFIAGGIQNE
jgi:hypothetical protein